MNSNLSRERRIQKIRRKKKIRRMKQMAFAAIIVILAATVGIGVSSRQANRQSEKQASENRMRSSEKQTEGLEDKEINTGQDAEKKYEDTREPSIGEALNVIERNGITKIYKEPSWNSAVINQLKDHETMEVLEVVPYGWFKVKLQGGQEGYAESVRVRTNRLPAHSYTKDSSEYTLVMSQDAQELRIYHRGEELLKSKTSGGIWEEFTPRGVFLIDKENSGVWDFADGFGEGYQYFTSFYSGGYLIHSIPMTQDQKVIPDEAIKLGQPASHGCIRLPIPVAKYIYESIPNGALLIIE